MSITYHKIDLFDFIDSDELNSTKIIIPHCVNNINVMGSGFVVPLYTRWPQVKTSYHGWNQRLGQTQFVYIDNDDDDSLVVVANMCGQNGILSKENRKPIRYLALASCMSDVAILAKKTGATIVAPKFGSDRAGGTWAFIEELIEEIWDGLEVHVCVI
jgi:hypothetical protein